MKYIRKVMAAGLAIIFCIALVIGTGVILSVRNVNVTFVDYSGAYTDKFEATRSQLNKLKGSGLLFIDDRDVYGKIAESDKQVLTIVSYEKKYPCTVDVVVRERIERFTYKTEHGYSVYDDYGKLIKTSADEENEPLNALDGCVNVRLNVKENQIEDIAGVCRIFADKFIAKSAGEAKAFRRMVESVSTEDFIGIQVAKITMRSGIVIALNECNTETESKIAKAYETYCTLSDSQLITGIITVKGGGNNAEPVAKYIP